MKSGTVSEMLDASFLLRVLVSGLLTASALSWLRWGLRPEQFGGPPAEDSAENRRPVVEPALETEPPEPIRWPLMAIFAMVFWVGTMLTAQVVEDFGLLPPKESSNIMDTDVLWSSMVLQCAVFVGLGTLLFATGSLRPEDVGITGERWPEQIAWGMQAFLASVLPTFLVILATLWFRSRETEHQFLRMVRESPDQVPVLLMFFTVAIVAPLSEELVFRVTLQGWLTQQWQATQAIITTAVIFSFVHGWRDGIALLPLALILGYLYHTRRSYLAVVATHSLFNASQLAMAFLGAMSTSE